MFRELAHKDICYKFSTDNLKVREEKRYLPEYKEAYEKIKTAIEITNKGYNLFLIDDYLDEKIDNLKEIIENELSRKSSPDDICYITLEDAKKPEILFLKSGIGNIFTNSLEEMQEGFMEAIFEFYNSSEVEEKENLLEYINKRRNEMISDLVDMAKTEGFDIHSNNGGFSFVPLKEGKVMTEEEYDNLKADVKEKIVTKVNTLKSKTKEILNDLKVMEDKEIDKIKIIMEEYLNKNTEEAMNKINERLKDCEEGLKILNNIFKLVLQELVNNYTSSYDDDELKINEIIYKYKSKVLVDNSECNHPRVIYEDDPSLSNLLGNIEFENNNGVYTTSVDLIRAGSLLKANEGCLIIRLNSLLNHPNSYYYLKKSLSTGKVDLNYNRGYLELLSLGRLQPEPININPKVILIGDYKSYDVLYNYDDEFKKIFKLRAESNPILDIDDETKEDLIKDISDLCLKNKLKPLNSSAIKEVAKYLSRKAGSKEKIFFDKYEIDTLITVTSNVVKNRGAHCITDKDIREVAYHEEELEKEIFKAYKEKKILMSFKDKCIGKANGLAVIDFGYLSLGKPFRITCLCCKGNGEIIDAQKESNLSGRIHNKSITILKGFVNYLFGGYSELPVDFHLSFEQTYGMVEGDSASVAEAISILSSITKKPIKQNIAVTGSINQFGEIQPIGGVNDKIEGFFKACKLLDKVQGKGVLIPESNMNDLVLIDEIEEAVKKGEFKIYTMSDFNDAVEILMGSEENNADSIMEIAQKELKKYEGKKNKHH